MNNEFTNIFPVKSLPKIKNYLMSNKLQEVRIKIEKPIIMTVGNREVVSDYIVSNEDLKYILQRISNYSLYAYEEEIRQGFITIKGGHRVGIAGECVNESGKIKTIRNISSLNIRICREIIGCSDEIMKYLVNDKKVYNTIIISPPKCGKTTLLRDIARNLSLIGKKISIIDERSEIAACYLGIPQMDIGIRCDVLDNCLKSEGMIMAIRSLSPDVIVCDEIGTEKDIESLNMAFNSGVNVIITIHGADVSDLFNRECFNKLINNNILERVVILENREKVGHIKGIYKIGDKQCLKLF